MFAAFAVTKSQYITQYSDHNTTIFFFFINLIYNHTDQTLLIRIKFQGILNPFLYNNRIKRTCDIICNSHFICFTHSINRSFGRNHNNRSFINPMELVHPFQNFKAVHLRHINIQQHQVDFRIFF